MYCSGIAWVLSPRSIQHLTAQGFDSVCRICYILPVQPLAGTPPLDSPAFWKQPYKVQASSDPDTATAQTIGIMCQHVRDAARDAGVASTAADAYTRFGTFGGDSNDARQIDATAAAAGAWWWCKFYVRFVHHEFIIRERLGESGHLQGLISPEVLIRMERPEGDCAIFSECVAAFLTALGVPFEFVTVAANPKEPEIFSHVYLYAVMPDGSRLPLDASHGDYPGWQVPSSHVTRRQVWDANGNRVADQGSRFDGLHNYVMRSGLGDDTSGDYGGEYTGDPNLSTLPYYPLPAGGGTYVDYSTGAPYSGPVYTAPSQNSAQWASFASSLAKMGFDLARINAIQPGTVVSANGAILRQNPGYAVGSPTSSLNLGGSSNLLLYGGLAVLALVAISTMKGGR